MYRTILAWARLPFTSTSYRVRQAGSRSISISLGTTTLLQKYIYLLGNNKNTAPEVYLSPWEQKNTAPDSRSISTLGGKWELQRKNSNGKYHGTHRTCLIRYSLCDTRILTRDRIVSETPYSRLETREGKQNTNILIQNNPEPSE